ncbi:MAG: hypothetical protein IBJ18_07420 [Phycisphaerales bacterium]|nr:hypothetical protein [Phycisphaerales bacterium]
MNEHETNSSETFPPITTAVLEAPAEVTDATDARARALMPSVEALIITSPPPASPAPYTHLTLPPTYHPPHFLASRHSSIAAKSDT